MTNDRLKRDIEQMRLIACLPDIYIKSRTKRELSDLMEGLDHSVKRVNRDEAEQIVLEYKKEAIAAHKRFKIQDELIDFRRQINQLLKAIVNPSSISGYHPDLDRIMILNRLSGADLSDLSEPEQEDDKERTVQEIYRDLWEENPDEDDLDHTFDQKQTEDLHLLGKIDWSEWQENLENRKEEYQGVLDNLDEITIQKLTDRAKKLDEKLEVSNDENANQNQGRTQE